MQSPEIIEKHCMNDNISFQTSCYKIFVEVQGYKKIKLNGAFYYFTPVTTSRVNGILTVKTDWLIFHILPYFYILSLIFTLFVLFCLSWIVYHRKSEAPLLVLFMCSLWTWLLYYYKHLTPFLASQSKSK